MGQAQAWAEQGAVKMGKRVTGAKTGSGCRDNQEAYGWECPRRGTWCPAPLTPPHARPCPLCPLSPSGAASEEAVASRLSALPAGQGISPSRLLRPWALFPGHPPREGGPSCPSPPGRRAGAWPTSAAAQRPACWGSGRGAPAGGHSHCLPPPALPLRPSGHLLGTSPRCPPAVGPVPMRKSPSWPCLMRSRDRPAGRRGCVLVPAGGTGAPRSPEVDAAASAAFLQDRWCPLGLTNGSEIEEGGKQRVVQLEG